MNEALKVAREQRKAAKEAALIALAREALGNPVVMGLASLALNQLAYKAGLWDARPSKDGQTYTWRRKWGFDKDGLHLGDAVWTQSDPEQIAAENATAIGTALIAASVAYAAGPKMPLTALLNQGGK